MSIIQNVLNLASRAYKNLSKACSSNDPNNRSGSSMMRVKINLIRQQNYLNKQSSRRIPSLFLRSLFDLDSLG